MSNTPLAEIAERLARMDYDKFSDGERAIYQTLVFCDTVRLDNDLLFRSMLDTANPQFRTAVWDLTSKPIVIPHIARMINDWGIHADQHRCLKAAGILQCPVQGPAWKSMGRDLLVLLKEGAKFLYEDEVKFLDAIILRIVWNEEL